MDGPGDQFLAGAAFAANQDSAVALGDFSNHAGQVPHGLAIAHDVAGGIEFGTQAAVLGTQRFEREHVLQSYRSDAGNGIQEVHVVFFKLALGCRRGEIDNADGALHSDQGGAHGVSRGMRAARIFGDDGGLLPQRCAAPVRG